MRLIVLLFLYLLPQLSRSVCLEDHLVAVSSYDYYRCNSDDYTLGKGSTLLAQQTAVPESRVTLWQDVVEGGKITLLCSAGCFTTGALGSPLCARLASMSRVPSNIPSWSDGLVFSLFGIPMGVLWGLVARFGSSKEKLTWRCAIVPTGMLVGISLASPVVVSSILRFLHMPQDTESHYGLCGVVSVLLGVYTAGYLHGVRTPVPKAIQVRPTGISVSLSSFFSSSADA